jgi:hypothetical protein
MSTDILRFPTDAGTTTKQFSHEALKYYLAITIPIMGLTLIASFMFRRWETYRVNKKRMISPV